MVCQANSSKTLVPNRPKDKVFALASDDLRGKASAVPVDALTTSSGEHGGARTPLIKILDIVFLGFPPNGGISSFSTSESARECPANRSSPSRTCTLPGTEQGLNHGSFTDAEGLLR